MVVYNTEPDPVAYNIDFDLRVFSIISFQWLYSSYIHFWCLPMSVVIELPHKINSDVS